jgi:hypothetical protein
VRLFREMEAIESDADDDEIQHMSHEDVGMMELPKELCPILSDSLENKSMPADLYVIPNRMVLDQNQEMEKGFEVISKGQEGKPRDKWGPVLMEPRPTIVPRDEIPIMEKARDRKKEQSWKAPNVLIKLSTFFCVNCF